MTSKIQLAATALLALGLLVAANIGLNRLAQNSLPRLALRTAAKRPQPDVMLLGNSVVAAGVDVEAFQETSKSLGHPLTVRNSGLGATGPVQHLALLRAALNSGEAPGTIVYGVAACMLHEADSGDWWRIFGNNALIFIAEPNQSARYSARSGLSRLAFQLAARVPMFVERGTLWSKVEIQRRRIGGIGLKSVSSNRFGRVQDFDSLAAGKDAENRIHQVLARDEGLPTSLQELLRVARSHGTRVIVVMLPLRPSEKQLYRVADWPNYLQRSQKQVESMGATFIDGSSWVADPAEFIDGIHLNPKGAVRFSRHLSRALLELGPSPPAHAVGNGKGVN